MHADVIVVCTANIARSPLLAVRLQQDLDAVLGAGAVIIASAGTDARYGQPAAAFSRQVAMEWGGSLEAHHARPLDYLDLAGAALVLTITRGHQRAVTHRTPVAAGHTIRVRELISLLDTHGSDTAIASTTPGQDPATQLRAVVRELLQHRRRRTPGRKLDVPNPIGGDRSVYEQLAEEFATASQRITALAAPGHHHG